MVCKIQCFLSADAASHQYLPQALPSVLLSSENPLPTTHFSQQHTALTSTTSILTPSVPSTSSSSVPSTSRVAIECDSLRKRQIQEHNIKLRYWRTKIEMLEEEKKFQTQIRELQLKEAEGRLVFLQYIQQKMKGSFHHLYRFLEAARLYYEATE